MDHEDDALSRLEHIIENLLDRFNTVQQEKIALEQKLSLKEENIAELENKLSSLQKERDELHARVTRVIDSIEKWEKNHVSLQNLENKVMGAQEDLEDISPELFSINS